MGLDPWLERWLLLLRAQTTDPAILELGCGEGRDTQVLLEAGFSKLTALDRREDAVAECQAISPAIRCLVHDLREPLPFEDAGFEVVLASLCLHYFPWPSPRRSCRTSAASWCPVAGCSAA